MSLADYNPDHFSHELRDDVVVVTIRLPRLSEDQNLHEFGQQLFAYSDQYNCSRIIVNCQEVTYASSAAIGKLITLHRKITRTKGRLVLCGLRPEFTEILTASRLLNYFETADDPDAALQAIQSESPSQ